MTSITFLMGRDGDTSSNKFFANASGYFSQVEKSTIVEAPVSGQTLEGVFKRLRAYASTTPTRVFDTINLVSHATGFSSLMFGLTDRDGGYTSRDRLVSAVADANAAKAEALTILGSPAITPASHIRLYGCDVGRDSKVLTLLASLFGTPADIAAPLRVAMFRHRGAGFEQVLCRTWGVPWTSDISLTTTAKWNEVRNKFTEDAGQKFGDAWTQRRGDPLGGDIMKGRFAGLVASATSDLSAPTFFFKESVTRPTDTVAGMTPIVSTVMTPPGLEIDDTTVELKLIGADFKPRDAATSVAYIAVLAEVMADKPNVTNPAHFRLVNLAPAVRPARGPMPPDAGTDSGAGGLGALRAIENPTFDDGRVERYEHGSVYFHRRVGRVVVTGSVLAAYEAHHGIKGVLGYPTGAAESDGAGGLRMSFERGALTVAADGKSAVALAPVPPFAPQVVVVVEPSLSVGLAHKATIAPASFLALAGDHPGPLAEQVLARLDGLRIHRLFDGITPKDLATMVRRAEEANPTYRAPKFENFLEIDCPLGYNAMALVESLRTLDNLVADAWVVAELSDPGVNRGDDPLFPLQGYLKPGPDGIGVESAWARGADGRGKRVIDIEKGWFLAHRDLPQSIRLLGGHNDVNSHGTAVLSEMVAQDDAVGMIGIAPEATADVMSYSGPGNYNSPASRTRLYSAVLGAGWDLTRGHLLDETNSSDASSSVGVILIEAQLKQKVGPIEALVPVEVDPALLEAIRLLTNAGVVVIECAGNGYINLDDITDREGRHFLLRTTGAALNPDFLDSGAIVVGAAKPAAPHLRWGITTEGGRILASNTGSRVDCYAWGDGVLAAADSNDNRDDTYFIASSEAFDDLHPGRPRKGNVDEGNGGWFGGTSGAAPIIAGAALLLLDLRDRLTPKQKRTRNLTPKVVRDILSSPANGTGSADAIGVMPDFAKIVKNEFVLAE